jgi:hypothetical protein
LTLSQRSAFQVPRGDLSATSKQTSERNPVKRDDRSGNAKDVCVKEAKAVEAKALADAKLGQEVGKAKLDAAQDKRDADYKVAVEKCGALAGDAKTSCIAAAKTKFGKN